MFVFICTTMYYVSFYVSLYYRCIIVVLSSYFRYISVILSLYFRSIFVLFVSSKIVFRLNKNRRKGGNLFRQGRKSEKKKSCLNVVYAVYVSFFVFIVSPEFLLLTIRNNIQHYIDQLIFSPRVLYILRLL